MKKLFDDPDDSIESIQHFAESPTLISSDYASSGAIVFKSPTNAWTASATGIGVLAESPTLISSDYASSGAIVFRSPTNGWTASANGIKVLAESPTLISSDYASSGAIVFRSPANGWTASATGMGVLAESPTLISSDYASSGAIVFRSPTNGWTASATGMGVLAESPTLISSDYASSGAIVFKSPTNAWTASVAGMGVLANSAIGLQSTGADVTGYLGSNRNLFHGTAASSAPTNAWEGTATIGAKKRRRFEVLFPLQFNNGKHVPARIIEDARRELLKLFGGVTWEKQAWCGLWEDQGAEYEDSTVRVFVDTPDSESNRQTMQQFNERWRVRLNQVRLYMTSRVIEVES